MYASRVSLIGQRQGCLSEAFDSRLDGVRRKRAVNPRNSEGGRGANSETECLEITISVVLRGCCVCVCSVGGPGGANEDGGN